MCLTSCYDDQDFNTSSANTIPINRYEDGVQLDNPYTTANMKMALDTIKAKVARGEYKLGSSQARYRKSSNLIDQFNVTTSHRYIKFTPQSEEEAALLKQDSTIILADYPLDYEFDDDFYTNRPELPEGEMPEYFASIPSGKSLPNVSYEQLAELYIPEEDDYFNVAVATPVTKKNVISNEEDLLHHLLYEAYALVGKEQDLVDEDGMYEDPITGAKWWFFGRRWRPSGTLKLWDDIGGTTPGGFNCYEGILGYEYLDCTSDTFVSIYDCTVPIYGTICDPLPPMPGGGFVPLKGAQVLMRQWFTVDQGITDDEGNFSTGTVRGKARYVIQWERYQYSIRNGSIFQAETRGPKVKNSDWNKNIVGGDDEYHAMIHTAAHEYYYGDRFGTKTPPLNQLGPQMKIAAREVNAQSGHLPFFSNITAQIVPVIHLKAWGDPSDIVYGTTIHELAHAAHRNLDLDTYSNVVWDAYTNVYFTPPVFDLDNPMGPTSNNNRRLMETWATTIETLFTRRRYLQQFGVAGYTYSFNNFQNRDLNEIHYTSAGLDMLEGNYGLQPNNQGFFNINLPIDRVNGYDINQLEDALIDSSSWWEWRDRIFNIDPGNPTRNNLNELFNNW
jgi:hypothetical protein